MRLKPLVEQVAVEIIKSDGGMEFKTYKSAEANAQFCIIMQRTCIIKCSQNFFNMYDQHAVAQILWSTSEVHLKQVLH